MAKFNGNVKGSRVTVNYEGGKAYKMADKEKLVSEVLTTFFNEKKFYGDNSNEIVADLRDMLDVDPIFVANLGVFAREQFYLRSVAHVIAAELANGVKGQEYVKDAIARICQRPDDMTEVMSYQLNTFGKPIPNSMKKGLANAFLTFDEYALQKYNGSNQSVKLEDVRKLVQPSPKDKAQYDLFARLKTDTLATPITWETTLSANDGRNKTAKWTELIENKKLGYMATLRNLRNMLEANVPAATMEKVYAYLQNENAVKNSKQLPFRFYSAYKMLKSARLGSTKLYDSLEMALRISCANLPRFSGTTFAVADGSSSMTWHPISKDSIIYPVDIATLLLSMAAYVCDDAITGVFATDYRTIPVSKLNGILSNMDEFRNASVGGGTNMYKAIQYLLDNKLKVDRIFVFSDNQCQSSLNSAQQLLDVYRRTINPNVWVHAVDLEGYGTQQFIGSKVNYISGWSEKTLQFAEIAENGMGNLVKSIKNYAFQA